MPDKTTNIKDKIAKLLALADSPEEGEAKAALLKARELMAKHKLRPEECQKAENAKVIRQEVGVTCTAMTNPWAAALSGVVAGHYCCRAYRTRNAGGRKNSIGIVGLEEDFEICKRVFLYAYECVISVCNRIRPQPGDESGACREKRNAYGWGFVKGLDRAYKEQDAEHQEWGLVLVVPKAVTDSMSDMGKPSAFGKVKRGMDEFKRAGYQDGLKFDPSSRLSAAPERAAIKG